MRKKLFKTRFLAMGLATAMVLSMVNVPAVANWQPPMASVQAAEVTEIDVTGEYEFDVTSEWDNNSGKENNIALTTDAVPTEGTTLEMDVLFKEKPAFQGILKAVGVLRIGADWAWVQSNTIPEITAEDFTEMVEIAGTNYYKAHVSIPFGETVGANIPDSSTESGTKWSGDVAFGDVVTDTVSQVTVQFAGYQCDYNGEISIANAQLAAPISGEEVIVKAWNFDDGIGSWGNAGWDYQYDGEAATTAAENGMLKINVDYSKNAETSWSQIGVQEWKEVNLQGVSKTTFDFYYDPTKLGSGSFSIKEAIQYSTGEDEDGNTITAEAIGGNVTASVNTENAEDAENGLKKATVTVEFDEVTQETCCNVVICIVGQNTGYQGAVYIDNLKMIKAAPGEDTSIDSTKKATGEEKVLSVANGKLSSFDADGAAVSTDIAATVKMVDPDATAAAKAVYAYLKAVGESDSVIYGHQNDTHHKAGSAELSDSDTKDVTGSYAGVIGIDTLSLTGNEYDVTKHQKKFNETLPDTPAGYVTAAAKLTNYNIEQGAIITLSAHMPNFSVVKERTGYAEGDPSYAKYDFAGYTPNTLTGNVMNNILPGGSYNEVYMAYLDMIADYASQVDGAILFRPFHENTGSWFWWGAALCDAETYKNVYRYTVEYLRDVKGVHNLIWVYGPGGEASSVAEYGERYPGNEYVDMVGFDMYNADPGENNSTWYNNFKNELAIVNTFAKENGKLIAVTETGVSTSTADTGHNQTALHITGNGQPDWYNEMLNLIYESDASYYLLWANFAKKDGFYTPYVDAVNDDGTLHGHEMMDNFIDFYNDARSVFAVNQKTALATVIANASDITVDSASEEITGYITSPIAGSRILESIQLTARISGAKEDTTVAFKLNGVKEKTLQASSTDSKTYSVLLDEDTLKALGEQVGSIELVVNGETLQKVRAIFNMPEPEADPYLIDDFENYYGVDSMLTNVWATNKASGSTINLSLTKETDKINKGEYGLKFVYNETSDGWAGATITKDVDWSDCNALQFYTIPDGNKQKYVIQITAGQYEYEAYLNQYEAYANSTAPMLVTIPFSEFVDRDGDAVGGLDDNKANIQSFGLWVNAIKDTPAFADGAETVTGTLYYDNITAVKTDATSAVFKKLDGSEEDSKKVEAVKKAIEAIKDVKYDDASKKAIEAARKAYDALTDEQKKQISADVLKKLTDAEKTYEQKKEEAAKQATEADKKAAADVAAAIDAIKDVQYSDASKAAIEAARKAYNALTDTQKALVPAATVKKLTDAEKVYQDKKAEVETVGKAFTDTKAKAKFVVTKFANGVGEVAYKGTTNKKATKITVPNTVTMDGITYKVTSIAANAFKSNKKITKVTMGSNIVSIGANAFSGCSKLATVTIGKNVKTIGNRAFYKCSKLTKITIPSKVTSIGKEAFSGCKKLKTVSLGKNVKSIGEKAFYKCSSMTKITIPSKVTSIGKEAFSGCKKLKTITIKTKKLTSKTVAKKAFKGVPSKVTVKVPKSKLKPYRRLLKSKGLSSKAKIKK